MAASISDSAFSQITLAFVHSRSVCLRVIAWIKRSIDQLINWLEIGIIWHTAPPHKLFTHSLAKKNNYRVCLFLTITHLFWRFSMKDSMSIFDSSTKSPTPNSGPSCIPAISTHDDWRLNQPKDDVRNRQSEPKEYRTSYAERVCHGN